jgi:hypothetical protein
MRREPSNSLAEPRTSSLESIDSQEPGWEVADIRAARAAAEERNPVGCHCSWLRYSLRRQKRHFLSPMSNWRSMGRLTLNRNPRWRLRQTRCMTLELGPDWCWPGHLGPRGFGPDRPRLSGPVRSGLPGQSDLYWGFDCSCSLLRLQERRARVPEALGLEDLGIYRSVSSVYFLRFHHVALLRIGGIPSLDAIAAEDVHPTACMSQRKCQPERFYCTVPPSYIRQM